MGKQGKKKGGKKDVPKEESSQSNVSVEQQPSTSTRPEEDDDDIGLTGGARKRKEKKEKKEKALQALQASRKPSITPSDATSEAASRAESEARSESTPRASEAPAEPSAKAESKEPSVQTSKTPSETPEKQQKAIAATKADEVAEEFEGLGLSGTKRKKPRKKKSEAPPSAEVSTQQAPAIQTAQGIPSLSVEVSAPVPTPAFAPVQPPEPVISGRPGTLARDGMQSAGRGRGWKTSEAPPSAEFLTQQAPATQIGQGIPSSSVEVSAPVPTPAFAPVQPPEPVISGRPGTLARGGMQSAGRGRGWKTSEAPPSAEFLTQQAPATQIGQGIPSSSVEVSAPVPTPAFAPVQPPEPVISGRPGTLASGGTQSAGRGRGWKALPTEPSHGAGPTAIRSFPAAPQFPPQASSQIHASQQQPQSVRPATGSRSFEPVLCRYKIPTKIPPGPRSIVRSIPIKVLVNYLEMEFKDLKISRYDVGFNPDRPKKMIPMVFQKIKEKYYPKHLIAFDQMKNCYCLHPLKNVTATERFHASVDIIDQNGVTKTFEVTIKFTGIVDLGNIKRYMSTRSSSLCHPTEEVQCIDVILRQGALESYVKAGRQFFKRPAQPVDLGYGYEMWTGLFQSAIFTTKSFINIDVAHKGFPKAQTLIDALTRDFNLDPTRPLENQRGVDYFTAFVKGLKVVALLVGNTPSAGHRREFVCNGLVAPPKDLVFTITEKDGQTRKTTVAEYFAKEKKFRLKFPNLNCLWVGSRERCIYFPMELLEVAYGQPLSRQLNEVQVSKMVREAATPPDQRMYKIKEVISNMKYSQNKNFKEFGLEISEQFYTVKAKILEPPTLDIGNGKTVPRKGVWQANRLLKPEPLQSWGLIAVDTDSRNDYTPVISLIKSTGIQMGMSVADPKIFNVNARMNSLHSILLNAYRDVQFLFIIVSARGRDDYHKIKQMAEREVGILTQCIKEMTARRMNPMTARNILLKVNSKLMGINHALESNAIPRCLREGGVMIVGADVTHPSPDQSNIPSIAAVTASIDPKCYIYNIELSIQTPKKEMIVEFEDMMFDHLRVYKERNQNTLPKKIFVFRDGVSEGQFAQVMNSELQAVHQAYQRMAGQSRKPEVLFLLVQKRHHTRLFPDGGNSRFNVEPGTVVDTDIVHASELDFYLVSHQAIKGTARPTRYHAVCNDGKIPDDEVEQLTYYLCHLYSRCTRAVSYPTPTYYAHLACLRARSLTHGERFDNVELERKPKRLRVLDKMLQFSRMFFV